MASPVSDAFLIEQKEGAPLVTPDLESETAPLYFWNETENPHLPMDPDSLSARVCNVFLDEECKECRLGRTEFLMASTADFALKQLTPDVYERDFYRLDLDQTYVPTDASNFPNVRAGNWEQKGYPTLIQQAEQRPGTPVQKTVNRIGIEMDALDQEPPGKLGVQLGTGNTPNGMSWDSAAHQNIDARTDTPEEPRDLTNLRPARPVTYAFFRNGVWVTHREYVMDSEENAAPRDCAVSLNRAQVSLKAKNTAWQNQ